jgi:capsular polysaccharide biosynthesis protein
VRPAASRLRRRWWLLVLPALLAAGAAYAYSNLHHSVSRYSAHSSVEVNLSATSQVDPSANASEAAQLAASYAATLPNDQRLANDVAARAGVPAAAVSRGLRFVHAPDSLVLRVRYRGASAAKVHDVLGAVARALTGPSPAVSVVAPRTLRALSPTPALGASATGGSRGTIALSVPLDATSTATPDPIGAAHLASTYASTLSSSPGFRRAVLARLHSGRGPVSVAVASAGRPLLQFAVSAPDRDEAIAGANAAVHVLAANPRRFGGVPAHSLSSVTTATSATGATSSASLALTLPIAVALGLMLGSVAIIASVQLDSRVEDQAGLARLVGAPCTAIEEVQRDGISVLVTDRRRTVTRPDPEHVTLLASDQASRRRAQALVARMSARTPGTTLDVIDFEQASTLAGLGSDGLAVVVARRDTTERSVSDTVAALFDAGRRADWSILA